MALVLRKCNLDGSSSYGFRYGQVGDIVTAPDWNSRPFCGNGLHGLYEGNGNWYLLEGSNWLVIEVDNKDVVHIDSSKCKFRTGKVLFHGNKKQLSESEFPNKLKLNSNAAFYWALNIGNHDIMKHKIDNSQDAYRWAIDIGNYDFMKHKIDNSQDAFYWAYYIGHHDFMKTKITNPFWTNKWNEVFIRNKISREN